MVSYATDTIIEAYDDKYLITDVNDLLDQVRMTEQMLRRTAVSISHDRPTNSIYVHAVVVYA